MHEGVIKSLEGKIKYSGGRIGIVVSKFNSDITGNLLEGTLFGLKKYGVPEDMVKVVKVPGAFEIPLATQKLLRGEIGGSDIVITLGVIVKGEMAHYEYVCKECADGIMQVQLTENKPVIFEVLMVENVELAEARAVVPDWHKNKGYVAALNALEMLDLYNNKTTL